MLVLSGVVFDGVFRLSIQQFSYFLYFLIYMDLIANCDLKYIHNFYKRIITIGQNADGVLQVYSTWFLKFMLSLQHYANGVN